MVFTRRASSIEPTDITSGNNAIMKKSKFGYLNRAYRHSTSTLVELAALEEEANRAVTEHGEEEKIGSEGGSSGSSSPRTRRSVLFGDIKVMEFAVELGDNPAVSSGCPMQIGWELQSSTEYNLDMYEKLRPPSERRSKGKLRISSSKRAQILMEHGHTMEEIAAMTLQTLTIKDSREQRIQNQSRDRFYEAIVMTGHRMKKVASLPQLASLVTPQMTMKRVASGTALAAAIDEQDPDQNIEGAVTA